MLTDDDLEEADLARFDAIVTGVRAYNTRPRLRAAQPRLLEWVAAGGTLVVQYNTSEPRLGKRLGPGPSRFRAIASRAKAPVRRAAGPSAALAQPDLRPRLKAGARHLLRGPGGLGVRNSPAEIRGKRTSPAV
jgi:hypothetical protein